MSSPTHTSAKSGLWKGRWRWVWVALIGLLAWRGAASLYERASAPRWIWGQEIRDSGFPAAFWAARDVELDSPPENAELRIVADEAYVLWINGWWVGSGTYRQGAASDVWQVGSLLQPGANRLLVELRSERGAGGLLVELTAGEQRLAMSDRHWRIFDRREAAIEGGWGDLSSGEPAVVWGRPPRGRWRPGPPIEALPAPQFGPEHRARRSQRSRANYAASPWYDPPPPGRRLPKVGQIVLYDFGEPVTGYLELRLPSEGVETALLYLGLEEPPDVDADRPQELIIPMVGASHWRSASAHRFRWAVVAGLELRQPAWVEPLAPDRAGRLASLHEMPEGVFGLAPTRIRSRVEEAIWKRLTSG